MARQTQGMGGVLSPGAAASSGARSVLLQAERLRAAFGTQDVFSIDRLELREGDRVALVGMNGAGKTTLMRALAGDGGLDVSGTVTSSGGAHYQPQLEDGDAQAEQGKLSQWGAKDLPKSGASGGERMRRKLAAAFSASANILLLDEPTANLDMQGVAWLERELKAFRGAVVIVSHDRMLMDNVCRAVWELDGGALTTYPGNYSDYWRQRAHARESAWREYRAYREEAARLKGAMREKTGKAAAVKVPPKRMWYSEGRSPQRAQDKFAKQAKDIASRLEHLEKVERPPLEPDLRAAMRVETPIVSRTAAYVRDFTGRYGSLTVLVGV